MDGVRGAKYCVSGGYQGAGERPGRPSLHESWPLEPRAMSARTRTEPPDLTRWPQVFPTHLWLCAAWRRVPPLPEACSCLQLARLLVLAGEPSRQPHRAHSGWARRSHAAPTWCEYTLVSFYHLLLSLKNYISICFHTPRPISLPAGKDMNPKC